jgi:hypothetical protein
VRNRIPARFSAWEGTFFEMEMVADIQVQKAR